MKGLAESGNKRARLVMKLAEDYDRLLSTILVGNNVVNIALSSIATLFFVELIGSGGAGRQGENHQDRKEEGDHSSYVLRILL